MPTLSRTLSRTLLALAAVAACLAVVPDSAHAAPEQKVTVCHRTNSRTNPYNQQAIAESSAVEGHASHDGPIFGPDVASWGDIIPPIRPDLPDGLNWTAEGRAIWENGCEMPPDPGPIPGASIGDVACSGATPTVTVTVSNAADATDPATFTIRVNGTDVQTVGPVAPGDSQTVTITGAPEDTIAVIEVLSEGTVLDGAVVTADCAPGPAPAIALQSRFTCAGTTPRAEFTLTDNTPVPVVAGLRVNGDRFGERVTVPAGGTETRTVNGARYEGQTIKVDVVVDGEVVATYRLTPRCGAPEPEPAARVAGTVCPPPTSTVTLANDGDPASTVEYFIRVDDRLVQRSAPLYGGDSTTIVVDLTPYEGRTAHVEAGYNGTVVVDRTVTIHCTDGDDGDGDGDGDGDSGDGGSGGSGDGSGDGSGGGSGSGGTAGGELTDDGALPSVGSDVPAGVVGLGGGLLASGALLLLIGLRSERPARR
jgi:uncharacterized membrane protein YgcG